MSENTARPIIVIKKKGGHGGHHGGAWKVAYADFVTAMMSLFIVLWLLNSTPQVKKAIAGYFNDPRGTSKKMGTDMLGSGPSVTIDQNNVQKLAESIKQAIVKQKELDKLSDQVELRMTDEGLRIELIDGKKGSFFESGSPQLTPDGQKLLDMIAGQLKGLPNRILLEGHTDAKPFGGGKAGYSNWELSADRANSARQMIEAGGVDEGRVAQVRGYAAQSLRIADDPLAAANRRISIVVQFQEAPAGTKGTEILHAADDDDDDKADKKEGEAAKEGGEHSKPSAAGTATPKPNEVQPSTGKIDLPPVPTGAAKPGAAKPGAAPKSTQPSGAAPSGKTSENLGNQLNQMRQMKQADAPGHSK